MSKISPMTRRPVTIAQPAGMDIKMPVAVRWSGDSPVRRRACPAGLTALSTAVRKRASNNYLLLWPMGVFHVTTQTPGTSVPAGSGPRNGGFDLGPDQLRR